MSASQTVQTPARTHLARDRSSIPQLSLIRQSFPRPILADIGAEVRATVSAKLAIAPGARVALAVGSRGIANLGLIVRSTVEAVRAMGGEPFVVPAMGSHGGGTAEGQATVLAGYGVTEEGVGCPIRSSMEVVELPGAGGPEYRVFMDRLAYESDGVIVINRIKPHTDFHDRYESGVVKMAVIGLGKAAQATEMHRYRIRGLTQLVPLAAEQIFASGKILLGLGIVENAYDETMLVEAMEPGRIMTREPELLAVAAENMPRLPVDRLDVLVVDRMGKDISGVGIDTNIIGRLRIQGQREPERPEIGMIVVTDLTDASHGNATGMGLADLTTRRMFEKIDFPVTNTNVATSAFLDRARLPMVAETDEQALEWALRGTGPHSPETARVIRIRDTLHLDRLYVSPAVLAEVTGRPEIEVLGPPIDCFDESGALRPF